eukprot:CAMPEP_0172626634 /NCGR_PEP_ID=MMETSP1068-20121228/151450_1 /TAXON_ID=35684 /ORGANISM="Pseudopedinella elastica, Strain CCMP716" /LENGTH=126 /DNA_ID=CAMNT_0013436305 /DNA_START=230 /DNA_END=614 /DNA_ORIENTATION=+
MSGGPYDSGDLEAVAETDVKFSCRTCRVFDSNQGGIDRKAAGPRRACARRVRVAPLIPALKVGLARLIAPPPAECGSAIKSSSIGNAMAWEPPTAAHPTLSKDPTASKVNTAPRPLRSRPASTQKQ